MTLDSKTLSYPVFIEDEEGNSGSGFFLTRNNKHFLVTARHVLFDNQGLRFSDILILTSYNHDKPKYRGRLRLDLNNLSIHSKVDKDIAVIELAETIDHEDDNQYDIKFYLGVSVLSDSSQPEEGDAHVYTPPQSNLIKLDQVKVSSDVYVLGFPSSLGKKSDQIKPNMPLLRKGAVAGINWENETIILDCPVYYGNSGGIAISVTDNRFYVIGVVSQFVPFIEHMISRENKYTNQNIENSGYAVAVPLDTIFELIDRA